MPRVRWKLPFFRNWIFRLKFATIGVDKVVWDRNVVIVPRFKWLNYRIYNGILFKKVQVRRNQVSNRFGDIVLSKKIGSIIHKEGKKSKKERKKKK